MFKVNVKSNKPWQVQLKELPKNKWTNYARIANQVDAEKEAAWLLNSLNDFSSLLGGYRFDVEIVNGRDKIWTKTISF